MQTGHLTPEAEPSLCQPLPTAPSSSESQGFLWRGLFFPFCGEGGEKWSRDGEAGEEEGEGAGRESWLQTEALERLGTAPRGHVPPPTPGIAPGHCWHPSPPASPPAKVYMLKLSPRSQVTKPLGHYIQPRWAGANLLGRSYLK